MSDIGSKIEAVHRLIDQHPLGTLPSAELRSRVEELVRITNWSPSAPPVAPAAPPAAPSPAQERVAAFNRMAGEMRDRNRKFFDTGLRKDPR
jgi:hypothetical protein